MDLYLHDGEAALGPFDPADVRARLAHGELGRTTMSWRPGEEAWTSLGRRWGSRLLRRAGIALGLLAACAAVAAAAAVFDTEALLPPESRDVARLAPLAWSLLAVAAIAALAHGAALRRVDGRVPASFTYAVLCVLVSAVLVVTGLDQRRTQEALRRATPDAAIAVADDGSALRIDGSIGPMFVVTMTKALDAHPGVRHVVIRSPGGLLQDAREAGRLLAARGVAVRASGDCASACVILWALSPQREIEADARIGLHRSRVDGSMSGAWKRAALAASEVEDNAVLQAAGFSSRLLRRRDVTGPEAVVWFDPAMLADEGVDLRIVDATGAKVSTAQARMLGIIGWFAEGDPAVALYRAVYAHLPELAESRGADVHGALEIGDPYALQATTSRLALDARRIALRHAPDPAVVAYGRRMRDAFDAATRRRDVDACAALDGQRAPGENLRAVLLPAIADLVAAVPADAAARRPARSGDRTALAPAVRDALLAAWRQGRRDPPARWPVLARCALGRDLHAAALRLPPARAARAIVALEGG